MWLFYHPGLTHIVDVKFVLPGLKVMFRLRLSCMKTLSFSFWKPNIHSRLRRGTAETIAHPDDKQRRDFARRPLAVDNNGDPKPDPINNAVPSWCICGNYIQMPTSEKNKCCQRRVCITSYELFNNLCIDGHVLGLAIRARRDERVEPLDFSMAPVSEKLRTGSLFYGNMGI